MNIHFDQANEAVDNLILFSSEMEYDKHTHLGSLEEFDDNKILLTNEISKLKKLLNEELDVSMFLDSTDTFKQLLIGLYTNIISIPYASNEHPKMVLKYVMNVIANTEKTMTLRIVSAIKDTIVLVGANGSGKSSYISYLKSNDLGTICVLPAHKFLYSFKDAHRGYEINIDSYRDSLITTDLNSITRSSDSEYKFRRPVLNSFGDLITSIVKEYTDVAVIEKRNLTDKREQTIFDKLETIWNKIIPGVELEIDANSRTINPKREGVKYNINSLSDGEKSILYYIGNVLLAPPQSYIIVDEPETYLNPSIYNKLWDLLIQQREDCQFIFASHTMDFISSRTNAKFLWFKNYIYPDNFDMKLLTNDKEIPAMLMVELLGSRKPIAFCEGTYESNDYKVYSKLFLNEYYVKPVGGHPQVINYTKAYNKLTEMHGNNAIGIIDKDFKSQDQISRHEKNKVFSTSFNEIEMLLLEENVIKSVLNHFNTDEEIVIMIDEFKSKFIEYNKTRLEKITLSFVKSLLEEKIQNHVIENFSTINDIENSIDTFKTELEVKTEYLDILKKIEKDLLKGDYLEILGNCNLKGEITGYLANELLIEKYEEKALKRIELDEQLQKYLKLSYFKMILKDSN